MLRCIFCGLCEEACPKDAIYLSETFTPADYQRKQFIYAKNDLLIPHPVNEPEAYKKALGNKSNKEKVN
jgi:NADH-quinone oxidoreductase subunit I